MSSPTVLELKNATIKFGGITAVNEFDMAIPKGSIAGLIGPNGAGKTTAFNLITGFYKPTKGSIVFNGKIINDGPQAKRLSLLRLIRQEGIARAFQHIKESVVRVFTRLFKHGNSLPPHLICKEGIARTFQNIRLFNTQTALNNVMVAAHVRQKGKWWMVPLMLPMYYNEEKRIREYALELLERLGLADVAYEPAGSLAYGAQRRLEIARALATKPSFLLLDEPAAGMNPQESAHLMELIHKIREDFDLTILLIEHDMKVVMGVCSHIWVLEYGICIADGTPEAIRNNPKVIEAYLGEEFVKNA